MQTAEAVYPDNQHTVRRYLQLAVVVLAAGAIYPLLYLRQNFELSILEVYNISGFQLGQCYAMLGLIFVSTYLPSGWLADRVSPRLLVSLSLALTGLLGLWFSSVPSFMALKIIFGGWGIATGLTFWAAHIKVVSLLAHHDEQGRFFGILDGGRGLVEAILATIAVALFAYSLETVGDSTAASLQKVVYLYVTFTLLLSPTIYFMLDENRQERSEKTMPSEKSTLIADLKIILAKQELWLASFCLLTGYQLFWATYSFSAYMQQNYGLSAVAVGTITVAKLWMRPIGGISAGFAGDYLNVEKVLTWLMVGGSVALAAMVILPTTAAIPVLLAIVLVVGLTTYGIKGIVWATLDACAVPARIKGLAIGVMSLFGYFPDIYLPLVNGALIERFPGKTGYAIYFCGIAAMGLFGAVASWRLYRLSVRRQAG